MKKTYKIMSNGRINIRLGVEHSFDKVVFYIKNGLIEFAPYYPNTPIDKGAISAVGKFSVKENGLASIAIPINMRRLVGLAPNDEIKILSKADGSFVIVKAEKACVFCGTTKNTSLINGSYVCKKCVENIRRKDR